MSKDNIVWEIEVDPDWGTTRPRRNKKRVIIHRTNFVASRPDPIEVLAGLARGGHETAKDMLEICEGFNRDRNGWPNCLTLTKLEVIEL